MKALDRIYNLCRWVLGSIFIYAGSTKLLEPEIQEIASRYELNVSSYEPIEQGAGNTNYLLNTNRGKFILTVFEIEPIRVAQMSSVLLLLEKYQFPAPRLCSMTNGEVLTEYDD